MWFRAKYAFTCNKTFSDLSRSFYNHSSVMLSVKVSLKKRNGYDAKIYRNKMIFQIYCLPGCFIKYVGRTLRHWKKVNFDTIN